MELTKQQQGQKATENYLRNGGKLTDPDSIIERFNAIELAQIIELEMAKASARGNPLGVRLKLNMVDSAALARFLRRGLLLGA